MVLGKKKEPVTAEYIFSKIDPFDVYKMYLSSEFRVNGIFESPFIHQKSPSFGVYSKEGKLYHRDFDPEQCDHHGDCIALVQQLHNLSYPDAIKKIAHDFQLLTSTDGYKRIVQAYAKPVITDKEYSFIQVEAKKWEKHYVKFWDEIGVSLERIKKEDVHCVKDLFLNRTKQYIDKSERVFAIRYADKFKIYFCDREKGKRWLSNIPLNTPMHLENLSKDQNGLVIPGFKDYMVCSEIYPYTCYVQNESIGAISVDTATIITDNSKEVFYGGDSDAPGKKASYKITSLYKWQHINPVDRLLPIVKDWTEWRIAEGPKKIEEHFKQKGLII